MLRKLLVFTVIAVISSAAAAASAQDAPAAPKDKIEKNIQSFSFVAPFERSYLGVQTVEISKENYAKFGLAQARGVGIEKVLENSPAANAGLQIGDVIVRFEGEEIKSASKLIRLIAEVAPDQTAKITVLRADSEREFSVTLGRRELPLIKNFTFENMPPFPASPRSTQVQIVPLPPLREGENDGFIQSMGANRQIGIGVTVLTKQLSDYFGVSEGRGLLINNVRENSPAAKAGLKAGDVIVEAEGIEIKEQADLTRAVNRKKEGDIGLTVVRDRNRQTLRVTPEISKNGAVRFEEYENLFEGSPNQMDFRLLTPPPAPSQRTAPVQAKPVPRIL